MTVRISSRPSDVGRVRQILRQQVSSLVHARSGGAAGTDRIVRIRIPLPEIEPLHWLRIQPFDAKIYWAGRDDSLLAAGAGIAEQIEGTTDPPFPGALREVRDRLTPDDRNLRYYGGFRFRRSRPGEELWSSLGGYRFVLPRFELRTRDDEQILIVNWVPERDADRHLAHLLEEIDRLRFPTDGDRSSIPLARAIEHRPDRDAWDRSIDTVLETLRSSDLEKAVLARRSSLHLAGAPEPAALLARLRRTTPQCFHFLVQPDADTAFVGASPERLYRRRGRSIESEAVAGTRPRGDSADRDRELRRELLTSAKDRSEHYYVRRHLERSADHLCEEYHLDEDLSVMSLATKHHLFSRLSGRLRPERRDEQILAHLHPTPAVAGYPTESALRLIQRLEPFDRGWYAGPVGWVGADAAEFAVSIRSALLRGDRLHLYAGAGIVERSVGADEWNELDQKIEDFTAFLRPNAAPDSAAAPS